MPESNGSLIGFAVIVHNRTCMEGGCHEDIFDSVRCFSSELRLCNNKNSYPADFTSVCLRRRPELFGAKMGPNLLSHYALS